MAELRTQLQTTLGTNTIERELGGGGMSRVFVAEDTTLGRPVVVKVLPPDMASGVSIERFKREISLAARLQHPHIVPLLSAGETGGLPYFTMPFIEGEASVGAGRAPAGSSNARSTWIRGTWRSASSTRYSSSPSTAPTRRYRSWSGHWQVTRCLATRK